MVEKITDKQLIEEYAKLDAMFGVQSNPYHGYVHNATIQRHDSQYCSVSYANSYTVQEYEKSGRMCAYFDGTKDSTGQTEKLILLGDGVTLDYTGRGMCRSIIAGCSGKRNPEGDDKPLIDVMRAPVYNQSSGEWGRDYAYVSFIGKGSGDAQFIDMFDYNGGKLEENVEYQSGLNYCVRHGGGGGHTATLTLDKNNTFIFANGIKITSNSMANSYWYFDPEVPIMYMGDIDYFNGDVFEECSVLVDTLESNLVGHTWNSLEDVINQWVFCRRSSVGDVYAGQMKLYNVPIISNYEQALNYIETGVIPDGAYLYPFDPANPPRNDGTPDPEDDGSDEPDEDGDSGIDGEPTPNPNPHITPNMITNNNLYWLQSGELERFINWFWTGAGDLLDIGDLWNRIQGLYNDLASAVLNIRYFPVDVAYIGGTSAVNSIIVGNIEYPINVLKLNKVKPTIRTLGEITIPRKYKSFCDYSPYATLMLYLPFHGWLELDVDLFMTNKIRVKCVYDHISGTIQYMVYVVDGAKEFIVNTCVAKMAVDIPITLQSKNDRDSAIFNNVAGTTANLIGAGASVASGSPIGLVMSTQGIANGSTQSAPLKVMGTQGETGAYFTYNRCCYYIKRPTYNRPKNYKSKVGYPCNKQGKLGQTYKGVTITGYTQVYNPTINFAGNKYDGSTMKPTYEEINEIYEYLEKGVIL